MKKIIIAFIFAIAGKESAAQEQDTKDLMPVLETEAARLDFQIFRDSLFQIHPCIDRYQQKETLNRLFDSCYAKITTRISAIELYRNYKFLLSAIQDGHVAISPDNAFKNHVTNQPGILPLRLYIGAQTGFVLCDPSGRIPAGTEITAINGMTFGQIINKLMLYIVSDGAITTKKREILNQNFWFYYYLVYGTPKVFKLQYKQKKHIHETSIIPVSFRKATCLQYKDSTESGLRLSFPFNNIAVLAIGTFSQQDFDERGENFPAFLEQSFQEIKKKKINCLIIDLRNNGGGKDIYGSLLYSYLTGKPFRYYQSLNTRQRKLTIKDHQNLALQQPHTNHYSGEVIFLINGASFSTTAEFCAIAKSNKRGLFAGEETGGGYYGNQSGRFIEAVLPHSKFVLSVPTTKYTMFVKASRYKNRGVLPDIEIIPDAIDILQKRDAVMEKAVQFFAIKKN